MNTEIEEVISGKKVFFITPDLVLFPEHFLEEYLASGFECYFIGNDVICPLSRKIDILVSVFKEAIIFFNIDAKIQGISWPNFISQFQKKYGDKMMCGVLFEKRQSEDAKNELEQIFLQVIQVQCGCIELEHQKKSNFGKIEQVLEVNNARGRRKSIRVICKENSTASLLYGNIRYNAYIRDISLSHFSCVMQDCSFPIKLYEKIPDIQINIKGLYFRSAAILGMIRDENNQRLFVFAFVQKDGSHGLETFAKQLLIPKLYELKAAFCKQLLDSLFYYKEKTVEDQSEQS